MSAYPVEQLGKDEDDGTMVESLTDLTAQVVGHRIVKAEREPLGGDRWWNYAADALTLTLDDGRRVRLVERGDCCAYTDISSFLLNPEKVDHIITGVGTTGGYTTWHIYADMGDVLTLDVDWSCGNPFYYGYGFSIEVIEADK